MVTMTWTKDEQGRPVSAWKAEAPTMAQIKKFGAHGHKAVRLTTSPAPRRGGAPCGRWPRWRRPPWCDNCSQNEGTRSKAPIVGSDSGGFFVCLDSGYRNRHNSRQIRRKRKPFGLGLVRGSRDC